MNESKYNFENLELLLSPFEGDSPSGKYIKRDPLLIELKELRSKILNNNIDDPGIWAKKNKDIPTWNDLILLCESFLSNQSKDLQVCAYLLEAKIYTLGFTGLASGLNLISNYCNFYWDSLNPPIEESDNNLRLSPFKWLQLNLPLIIKKVQLVKEFDTDDQISYTWFWLKSESKLGTKEAIQANNKLAVKLEQAGIQEATHIYNAIIYSIEIIKNLEDEYLSLIQDENDEISFSETISIMNEIKSFFEKIFSFNDNETKNNEEKTEYYNVGKNQTSDIQNNLSLDEINSTEDAYRIIEAANKYLLSKDPHSPSPYLIRRAIEWQKKSLYGVLMELFTTTSKPQEIFTLLGLSHLDKNKLD